MNSKKVLATLVTAPLCAGALFFAGGPGTAHADEPPAEIQICGAGVSVDVNAPGESSCGRLDVGLGIDLGL
ncbi:hypothetical protein P8605_08215 [Streptomyces sp. T-3]|nr:hypothetical protein [Streptomyces sp. T-3]